MSDSANRNQPKKDYLPKDKRLRLLMQIVIGGIGVFMIISGIRQMMGAS